MQLVDEEQLTKFVTKIVLNLKPELKSNLDRKDVKQIVRVASREWLNVKDSASYLGVSDTTFRKWRHQYKIPSRTIEGITRWKKSDLDQFWESRGIRGYL
ncbi:helix-turn-helix domain-containing protein [Lactobacillus crispatus]|uniref:helix-turn-helix domain-containing protein n=1 Tax=Lactobacillus crispatus TaxID=47770 RepID=UPI0025513455|nr:helix-turn-helix domain-containing protein [Lactobacillus crispatus]MDK6376733.1 helix-turn-helix domain-containing protein [Lactobacillus crispatus]